MEATERTGLARAPAWPTLLGVHLVVLAVLAGAWWRGGAGASTRPSPTQAQVLAIPPAQATVVAKALASQQRSARALVAGDERRVRSFLSLTAAAAGMQLLDARFEARASAPGGVAQPVVAWLDLSGDAFDLPVFLDGLHRQAALVRVDGVVCAVRPGGQARARVLLRFHRPVLPDAAALGDRVDRTAPTASDAARAALLAAGELAAWRAFAATEPARAELAARHRSRLQQELAPALVAAWRDGGPVRWSPGDAAPSP